VKSNYCDFANVLRNIIFLVKYLFCKSNNDKDIFRNLEDTWRNG